MANNNFEQDIWLTDEELEKYRAPTKLINEYAAPLTAEQLAECQAIIAEVRRSRAFKKLEDSVGYDESGHLNLKTLEQNKLFFNLVDKVARKMQKKGIAGVVKKQTASWWVELPLKIGERFPFLKKISDRLGFSTEKEEVPLYVRAAIQGELGRPGSFEAVYNERANEFNSERSERFKSELGHTPELLQEEDLKRVRQRVQQKVQENNRSNESYLKPNAFEKIRQSVITEDRRRQLETGEIQPGRYEFMNDADKEATRRMYEGAVKYESLDDDQFAASLGEAYAILVKLEHARGVTTDEMRRELFGEIASVLVEAQRRYPNAGEMPKGGSYFKDTEVALMEQQLMPYMREAGKNNVVLAQDVQRYEAWRDGKNASLAKGLQEQPFHNIERYWSNGRVSPGLLAEDYGDPYKAGNGVMSKAELQLQKEMFGKINIR